MNSFSYGDNRLLCKFQKDCVGPTANLPFPFITNWEADISFTDQETESPSALVTIRNVLFLRSPQ
jgi:hypothetical protein